jgi:biotin operon repressor
MARIIRTRASQAKQLPKDTQQDQVAAGLAGAALRGEAARVQWVKDGLVVPGEQLAKAWGLTRQALAPAADRGEIFAVKVGNRLYYPQAFLGIERETVAAICRALGGLGASEKLMFWLRDHGALSGKSVAAALEAGLALAHVERLAAAWARERGATRVAEAA